MKTFVLTVSKHFPLTHSMSGKPTNFIDKINLNQKIHTIRLNYDLWEKRVNQINEGTAILSLRHWTGRPYNSKQKEFAVLHDRQVGIQKIKFIDLGSCLIDDRRFVDPNEIADNDGLSIKDFIEWFHPFPTKPAAIIHFSNIRY